MRVVPFAAAEIILRAFALSAVFKPLLFALLVLPLLCVPGPILLVLTRPFLTLSSLKPQHRPMSFVNGSTSEFATVRDVDVSIGASGATRPIQLSNALPSDIDLSCVPDSFFPVPLSASTCVNVARFDSFLDGFCPRVREFLVNGLSEGFRIGFLGDLSPGRESNNSSAAENAALVSEAILEELRRGHTVGPFATPPFPFFHCSPPWCSSQEGCFYEDYSGSFFSFWAFSQRWHTF